MSIRIRSIAAALCAWLVLVLGGCGGGENTPAQAGAEPLPAGFFGITAAELGGADAGLRRQALDAQHRAGARTLRQWINWADVETRRGRFDFRITDQLITDAARSGLRVVPILFGMPRFHAAAPRPGARVTAVTTFPPRRLSAYERYVTAVAKRYGRRGSFWRKYRKIPARPIEAYQVWNEPNLPQYWGGRPDARAYVRLLRAGATALRRVDPDAEILAGGLPESRQGVPMERFIQQMYDAGAKGTFDTLAVHPYATDVSGVLAGARRAREVAVANGDSAAGLWITEIGWAAGDRAPGSSFTVSEQQQAENVIELYRQGAAQAATLNLRGIIYYAWRDVPPFPGGRDFWGLHTGLVNRDNSVKPALSAYKAVADELERGTAASAG